MVTDQHLQACVPAHRSEQPARCAHHRQQLDLMLYQQAHRFAYGRAVQRNYHVPAHNVGGSTPRLNAGPWYTAARSSAASAW